MAHWFGTRGRGIEKEPGSVYQGCRSPTRRLGINLPGYAPGQGLVWNVPIEELGFYLFGGIFMLSFYVFGDLYWVAPRNKAVYNAQVLEVPSFWKLHCG